jgi:hypothetical protein
MRRIIGSSLNLRRYIMTMRERKLACRLIEKLNNKPEIAKELKIVVEKKMTGNKEKK